MANYKINNFRGNIGGGYILNDNSFVDPFDLNKFNPNTNQNFLLLNIEDANENSMIIFNIAPPQDVISKYGWTTHDIPMFFKGTETKAVNGEAIPRVFSQFVGCIPSNATNLNLGKSNPMAFEVSVIQTNGVNFLGAFNTVLALTTAHTPSQALYDEDAIAYVWAGDGSYYKVQFVNSAYAWVRYEGAISLSLREKQYNTFTLQVQRGFRNPAPIVTLQDEQYRIIWQELSYLNGLYATLNGEIDGIKNDIVDLKGTTIKTITKVDSETVALTLVRLDNNVEITANVRVVDSDVNLLKIEANGLIVNRDLVVEFIVSQINDESSNIRQSIIDLINETVDINVGDIVDEKIQQHNTSSTAHADIRLEITNLNNGLIQLKEYVDIQDVDVLQQSKNYTDLVASGKQAQGIVFVNNAQIEAWLSGSFVRPDGILPSSLRIGQDIYTLSETNDDYWVNSVPVLTMANLSRYGGGSSEMNPYTIKVLYESNPNTNAFTDIDKQKVELIVIDGDGTYFLSNDGTYKLINVDLTPIQNQIDLIIADMSGMQHKLTAGENITIVDNVISSTYPEMTQALIDAGTSTTDTVISPKLFKDNLNTKENLIVVGTTAQYLRGDKTWQTLNSTAVGLGNVNNTSDANKPISTATQTALNAKVDKVAGKQLSTNDFTTAEKTKLSGIATNAQVNVLEGVQLNGTDVAISSKKSNIVVNKTTVGLGNVPNVDTTNPANITQSATYRFVTDSEKSTWNGKQDALTAGDGISISGNVISADSGIPVETWNTATKTLALSDSNKLFRCSYASDQTLTIPTNATVAFPIGTMITFLLTSTYTVTFVGASGVTLTSIDSLVALATQFAMASIIKTDINTWQLVGALE